MRLCSGLRRQSPAKEKGVVCRAALDVQLRKVKAAVGNG